MLQRFCIGIISLLFVTSSFALEVGDTYGAQLRLQTLQMDGTQVEKLLTERGSGQEYVILDFFQTTCIFCKRNLPGFSALAKRASQVAVSRSVALDRKVAAVLTYVDQNKSFFVFDVPLDSNRDAAKAFEIAGTPTLFILNAQNKVVYKHEGLLEDPDFAKIDQLLGLSLE